MVILTNIVQKIAKNTSNLFFGHFINQFLVLLSGLITARKLGTENFGIISFSSAFVMIFGLFTDLGFHTLATREISKQQSVAKEYFNNIFSLKILAGLGYIIITNLILIMINSDFIVQIVVLISSITYLINSFVYFYYSYFQAFEKMKFIFSGYILNALILFLLTIYAFINDFSIIQFSLIPLFANLFNFITLSFILRDIFSNFRVHFPLKFLKKHIKEALPFGITATFIMIYLWNGTIILSLLNTYESVGIFNASFKIIFALMFISVSFNIAIFPLISKISDEYPEKVSFIMKKQFKYFLYLSFPLATGGMVTASNLIGFTLGKDFQESIIVLQIIIWSVPSIFIRSSFERVLESSRNQEKITKAYGFGLGCNFLLNLLLIPYFSYLGASLSIITSDFVIFLILFHYSWNLGYKVPIINSLIILGKACISCLIMTIFIIILIPIFLLGAIFSGIIIYITVLYVINGFDQEDKRLVKKLFENTFFT